MPGRTSKRRHRKLLTLERLEQRELLSTLITGSDHEAALGAVVRPLGNLVDVDVSGPRRMVGDDFVVAEPLADPLGRENAGAVYVVFGGEHLNPPGIEGAVNPTPEQRSSPMERLLSQAQAIRIVGARAGDNLGFSVAAVGDVIGGPEPDLLIGAPFAERIEIAPEANTVNRGRAYLIGGDFILNVWQQAREKLDLGIPLTLDDVTIDLSQLDPAATTQPGSWQIYEGARPGDNAGYAVAGIGGEFIVIGAPRGESPSDPDDLNRGAVYVIGGAERAVSPGILNLDDVVTVNRGSIVYGPSRGARLGASVSGVADPGLPSPVPDPFSVDGSPEPDFIVGAPGACADDACPGIQPVRPGRVYFLPGTLLATAGTRGIYELNNNADLLNLGAIPVQGKAHNDRLGQVVASAGDLDNDGISDFMFSAPNAEVTVPTPKGQRTLRDAGEVYIVFGRELTSGFFTQRVDINGNVQPILVSTFVGSSQPIGVTIQGAARGDRTGLALAPAGNVRDPQGALSTADDIVIGVPLADVKPEFGPVLPDAGRVYLIFGNDAYQIASGTTLPLATLLNSPLRNVGVVFEGRMERQFFGTSVAGIGNVLDSPAVGAGADIGVGSPGADTLRLRSTVEDAGEVEILFGSPVVGGVLTETVPAGFPNPGPFGPQIIVGGYWSGGDQLPPAGTIIQFPLNFGLVGPFSAPYALGGANYYPDKPSALVDRTGNVTIVERRGNKLVAVNVTAQVNGPRLNGTSDVLTNRSGRIAHVFGVTVEGHLAWYRKGRRGWTVTDVHEQVRAPRLYGGVDVARVKGGFVVAARTRNGGIVLFRYTTGRGWNVTILNGSSGPRAPRLVSDPALMVARPATNRPWFFLYGVKPNGQLIETRLIGNRARIRPVDAGTLYEPRIATVFGHGYGRNLFAVTTEGALVHLKRKGPSWVADPIYTPPTGNVGVLLERGIVAGAPGTLVVYVTLGSGELVEFRATPEGWEQTVLPGDPLNGGIAQLLHVSAGADGADRVLLALNDRGLLVRYAYLSDGSWNVELGGDDGDGSDPANPETLIDLLVELGLNVV